MDSSLLVPYTDKAIATILEKTLGRLCNAAGDGLSTVFMGTVGHNLGEWRKRNQLKAMEKTHQFLKDKGINLDNLRELPEFEAYAIFQGISEQDNDDVLTLWARLIAGRLDKSNTDPFDKQICNVLSMMNGDEAKMIVFLSKFQGYTSMKKIEFEKIYNDNLQNNDYHNNDLKESLLFKALIDPTENMTNLGYYDSNDNCGIFLFDSEIDEYIFMYHLHGLGKKLVKRCIG